MGRPNEALTRLRPHAVTRLRRLKEALKPDA